MSKAKVAVKKAQRVRFTARVPQDLHELMETIALSRNLSVNDLYVSGCRLVIESMINKSRQQDEAARAGSGPPSLP